MYYQRFGLAGPPFESGSSHAALFLSTPYRQAFAAVEWGLLHETSGFTLLAGEPGIGKTTLINALLAQHREHVHTVSIQNPRLQLDEIMSLMVEQLGVKCVLPTRLGLCRAIEEAIAEFEPTERVVVIVDEAQGLTDERIEDLRLLSNCDSNQPRRLHFILVGQPELLARLQTPALRNLNQRIGARAKLSAISHDEAWDYVDYRLKQQGGSAQKIFNRRALRHLIAASGGILRQINLLCTAAIACAHAQNESIVTPACARAAVAEYRNLYRPRRTFYRRFAAAGVAASVTAVAAVGLAAALVVRHVPAHEAVPPQAQVEPTVGIVGSIGADAPVVVDAESAPEIVARRGLKAGLANISGVKPAKPPFDGGSTAMATAPDVASGAPSTQKGFDAAPPGNRTTMEVPAAVAPVVQASAVSPSEAVHEPGHSAAKRRGKLKENVSRPRASYRREQDDEEPVDSSDSPPIEPADTDGATNPGVNQ